VYLHPKRLVSDFLAHRHLTNVDSIQKQMAKSSSYLLTLNEFRDSVQFSDLSRRFWHFPTYCFALIHRMFDETSRL
jgi:hypothetical protein